MSNSIKIQSRLKGERAGGGLRWSGKTSEEVLIEHSAG